MTKIFFDTEFTSLSDDARLISIGLVDETGYGTFYAEVSDTYSIEDCSEFCRQYVLPLLEHGDARMTFIGLQNRIIKWLAAYDGNVVLICDSPRDITQLKSVFPDELPQNCVCQVLGFWGNLWRRMLNFDKRLHKKHKLHAHHALNDALVNKIIFARGQV